MPHTTPVDKHPGQDHLRALRKQVRRFWADHGWLMIGIAAILVFVLGMLGFREQYEYFEKDKIAYTGWDLAHMSFQLFRLSTVVSPGPKPWLLELARTLAAIITLTAAIKALMLFFQDKLQQLRLLLWTNHVVICGLGEKGRQLALDQLHDGERVLVIDQNAQNDEYRRLLDQGVIVFPGDANRTSLLRKARVDRARHLFAVTPNDWTNMEIGLKAHQLMSEEKTAPPAWRCRFDAMLSDTLFRKQQQQHLCGDCEHVFTMADQCPGKRIFLSYGHDEYVEIAVRLKHDLEHRGYHVWFDQSRLVGGTTDWEHAIETGLAETAADPTGGVVIFLITPHSARRPDGYCLNELTRALEKKLTIIPVMLVWCELPLSICRTQWLDMQNCLQLASREGQYGAFFDRLCEAVEHGRIDHTGGHSHLLFTLGDTMPSFEAEITRHVAQFVGRDWLLATIDRWLEDPAASRVFWLTGKPGSGKSALAAWLCTKKQEIAAFHLCSHGHTLKADPAVCVRSIAYQLSTQLPLYHERLDALDLSKILDETKDAKTLFDLLVAQPLSRSFPRPDRCIIILIDALDEATVNNSNELATFLATSLDHTPDWLRLIITSRPDAQVCQPLQAFTPFSLDTLGAENESDIRHYLATRLAPHVPGGQVPEATLNLIWQKSEGLFLYAHWLVREIEAKRLSLDNPGAFPQGLGSAYGEFFRRQFAQDLPAFASQCRPLLELVAASREPLSPEYAAKLLGWDNYQTRERLNRFSSLLHLEQGTLRPFHLTLIEWLTDSGKAGDYFVDTANGHRYLAESGWDEYQKDAEQMSAYANRYLADHLLALERWESLGKLLTDPFILGSFLATGRTYLLTGYWLTAGNRLDMLALHQKCFTQQAASPGKEEESATYAMNIARLLQKSGSFKAALEFAQAALYIWENLLEKQKTSPLAYARFVFRLLFPEQAMPKTSGLPHRLKTVWRRGFLLERQQIAECLDLLASLRRDLGQAQDGVLFAERALEVRRKILGNEHPDTMKSLSTLATLWQGLGRYSYAIPYAKEVLAYQKNTCGPEHSETAAAWNTLANFLRLAGIYGEAEKCARTGLGIRKKILGVEHPDTAASISSLARTLSQKGQYDEAEALHHQALDIQKKALGVEHPDTAASISSLAATLSQKGQYDEAEALGHQALDIQKKVLGVEHPDTAWSISSLAATLSQKGQYDEAEALDHQALDIQKKILGLMHPDTAWSIYRLAIILYEKGQYDEAEKLVRQTLDIRKKVLEEEHPDTARSIYRLAIIFYEKGQYDEAEALDRQALDIRKKILGVEHPDTAASISSLAATLSYKGQYDEAEAFHHQALDIQKKVLGLEHPDTARSICRLAGTLFRKGQYDEAEAFHHQALDIQKKVLGLEHPDTAWSIDNLAVILFQKGQYDEAEKLVRQALDIRKKVLGFEHPNTARSIYCLAATLSQKGQYDEAEALHRQALDFQKKVLGLMHPDTAWSIYRLAATLFQKGQYDEAEALHHQALDIRKKVLGVEHPDTARSIYCLAGTLFQKGQYDEAEALDRQALDIRKKILGLEHPDTAGSLSSLAETLSQKGQYDEAEALHHQALDFQKKVLGLEHPETTLSLILLGINAQNRGNFEQAQEYYQQSLEACHKALGHTHPTVAPVQFNLALLFGAQGNLDAAIEANREALAIAEKVFGHDHATTTQYRTNLGDLLSQKDSVARTSSHTFHLGDLNRSAMGGLPVSSSISYGAAPSGPIYALQDDSSLSTLNSYTSAMTTLVGGQGFLTASFMGGGEDGPDQQPEPGETEKE